MAELDTNQDRLAPRNFFSSSSVPLARRKSKDTAEDRGVGDTPTIHFSHPARLRLKKKKKKAGQKNTKMRPAPTGRFSMVKNCQKSLRQWPK